MIVRMVMVLCCLFFIIFQLALKELVIYLIE